MHSIFFLYFSSRLHLFWCYISFHVLIKWLSTFWKRPRWQNKVNIVGVMWVTWICISLAKSAYSWHGVKVDRVTWGHVAHAGCMVSTAFARACAIRKMHTSAYFRHGTTLGPLHRVDAVAVDFVSLCCKCLKNTRAPAHTCTHTHTHAQTHTHTRAHTHSWTTFIKTQLI